MVSKLGEGGMGVVYAAYDPKLDRKVAVKLLQPEAERTGASADMLLDEARAMAKLAHPNVLAIYDVGTDETHGPFLALELVEGVSLRGSMREKPPSWREAVAFFLQAGEGLAAAHDAGIIHRDFKPDNLLLSRDGRVRVMDFGLAHGEVTPSLSTEKGKPNSAAPLTRGTLAYLAPEQFEAGADSTLTDQFSYGVALHEALYGVRPFVGKPGARRVETRWQVPEAPRASPVPLWVRKVVLRALSPLPNARFESMEALLRALRHDPRLRWRRAGLVAAALGLLALGVGTSRVMANRRSQACEGAEELLAGIWDMPRQAGLRQAFLMTGSPLAEGAWSRTEEALERYARGWTEMRTQSCRATRVREEQTEEALGLRTTCLDHRLFELQSLSDLLLKVEASGLAKASEAANKLTDLGRCVDVASLRGMLRPVLAPQAQAESDAERKHLAEAKERFDLGDTATALSLAERARAVGARVGDVSLETVALLQLGEAQALGGEVRAEDTLWRGITRAYAAQDATSLAEIAIELESLQLNFMHPGDAERTEALAQVAVERPGTPLVLQLRMKSVRALRLRQSGHFEEAIVTERQVVAMGERLPPSAMLERARMLNTAGIVFDAEPTPGQSDTREEGRLALLQSIALRQRLLGDVHPSVAAGYMNLCSLETNRGNHAEGEKAGQHAYAILVRALGKQGPMFGSAAINYAEALRGLGKWDAARAIYEEAVTALSASLGADDVATLMAKNDLASTWVNVDDSRASQAFEENLAVTELKFPESARERLRAVVGAERFRARRSPAAARLALKRISRVLELQRAPNSLSQPADWAETLWTLAEVTARIRPGDPKVAELVHASEARFQELHYVASAEAVRRWLTQQPGQAL